MAKESFLSSTSKARLQADAFPMLDSLFGKAHPSDVPELAKEIRSYVARIVSAARRPGYDRHSNNATDKA